MSGTRQRRGWRLRRAGAAMLGLAALTWAAEGLLRRTAAGAGIAPEEGGFLPLGAGLAAAGMVAIFAGLLFAVADRPGR